jgi:hypothetical protein
MATAVIQDDTSVLGRTVMLAGEVFVPGASELIKGNIGTGVGSILVAGAAAVLLGPTMPILAAAVGIGVRINSYQDATTGRTLFTSAKDEVDKLTHRKSRRDVESEEPVGPKEPVASKK